MAAGYEILIARLDEFIRKYYKNRIIRGLLYCTSLILIFYLAVIGLESVGHFSSDIRTVLFWTFIGVSGAVVVRNILIPTFKLFHLGDTISHEEAATIIGKHFNDVEDKLLNTLQLREMVESSGNTDLVNASIDQRISQLKPVPFTSAVDFSENKKYLKYAIPPLAIIVILLFAAPSFLTGPTDRLVRFNEEIENEAPFKFHIRNAALEVPENDDFELMVGLSGDVIPDRVFIELKDQQYKLSKDTRSTFNYLFRNVNRDTPFRIYAAGFYSPEYTLNTLPSPQLVGFESVLDYPGYTGLTDETVENTGDLTVPAGTKINWKFLTRNTSEITMTFKDSTYLLNPQTTDQFGLEFRALKNESYSIQSRNELISGRDSIVYRIQVIPDLYPQIAVEEEADSLSQHHVYFTGDIKDDYGFKRLTFNYTHENSDLENPKSGGLKTVDISINKTSTVDQFFYHWDLSELDIQPGDQLAYYFEVWDNDGVRGAKSSRTQIRSFITPSLDDLLEDRDQKNEDIKKDLEESIKDAKEVKKDLEDLRKDLLEKEELSWQDKKKIEDLLKKQKELQSQVQNIQNKNAQKNQQQSEYQQMDESLLQKQQKLQELMDQIMTDEMREMLQKLEELMENLQMEDIQEQIEDMEMSNEDMEKELDRALEQFKQLEWELKMEEAVDKLEELAEKQEELSEESKENDKENSEELKEKQDELNEEFKKWEEEMEKIEELNEALEEPNAMPEQKEESESIKEDMEESSEKLEQQKMNKASESQSGASEKMKKMAQKMEMMMQQQQSDSVEEDMEALRALLENIITLSFDQEELMSSLKKIDNKDPKYVQHAQTQRKLKDDAKMVEDSLFALSKRIIQLQAPVNREISLVNDNMKDALEEMGERRTDQVTSHQQYVMTSFNNLALLLDEALQQLQKECSSGKPGKGNCEKPGGNGNKPSASQMKKAQQSLSKQLEKMKKEMEGFNKGESKGKGKMSEDLAKMAAKQAAIRREVEKMSQDLNEDGSGSGNEMKKIAKDMEDIERDLVNKKMNQETLNRQRDIMTRLLKAEDAEREREMDNQRKSNEAIQQLQSNPMKYSEYQKKKEKEVEMLKTLPPALKPHYKEKVNNYFNKLGD